MEQETKTCIECGRTLPVTEFYKGQGSRCKECFLVRLRSYHKKPKEKERDKYRRKSANTVYYPKPSPAYSPPTQDVPLPSLEIGKTYVIKDWTSVKGSKENNNEAIVYRGPCVARWGRNWGIATSTGIRCFTPGTLVGLDVREVGKSA